MTTVKRVKCADREVIALIDTCADITVISEAFANQLRLDIEQWKGQSLVFVTGSPVQPRGAATVTLEIDGRKYQIRAIIVKTNRLELLIGNDVLHQTKRLIVDYKHGKTTIQHRTKRDQRDKVTLAEAVYLPPKSTVAIPINRIEALPGQLNILEPIPELMWKNGISMGRAIVEGPISRVYLTNFGNVSRKVEANCCLAQLEPVTLREADPSVSSGISEGDFLERIDRNLSDSEKKELVELLMEQNECFAMEGEALGQSKAFQHAIPTTDNQPIHIRPYASAWKERRLIDKQVQEMLQQKVIEPSLSPWSAPVVLVKKKDGSWRFCVDYRKLNAITLKTVYPLPRIDEALARLEGSSYFSSVDLQSGYWQLVVRPEDQEKTAFTTADGHYQFRAMPFGLSGAAHTFQRAMDTILANLKWTACLVYLDDIVIFGRDLEEHNARLRAVLQCLRTAGMKIKLSKCRFAAPSLHILGHVVSGKGVATDPEKIMAVEQFPVPKSVKEVQSFLGLCSYFRKFVSNFSWIARPLTMLLKKKQKWQWQHEQSASFELLKQRLVSAPLLGHADLNKPMEIHPDACAYGIGALLTQQSEEGERPLAYASRLLSKSEENYSITEKECLALVWATKKFRPFIWGQKVKIVTDHHALCWLLTKRDLAGRLARWSLQLQDYDLEIVHRSGRKHQDADCLSRAPVGLPAEAQEDERHVYLISEEEMNWMRWQSEDPVLQDIRNKWQTGSDPKIQRDYVLLEGKLFKKTVLNDGLFYRLCVPMAQRKKVLSACHDSDYAGHMGKTRTRERVLARYTWPGVYDDVDNYVRTCPQCQTRKHQLPRVRAPQQHVEVTGPFETIGVDVLGPFPRSSKGNRYVVLAVDYLTKWTMTRAIPRATADEVIKFFLEEILYRHGSPSRIITDNGKCFVAKIVEQLLRELRVRHNLTSIAWPRGNALAERTIRTITDMIAMFVIPSQENWDGCLPALTFAYNSSRQEATGKTPFFLLFGREPRLPIDTTTGVVPVSIRRTGETEEQFAESMRKLHEQVKQRIMLKQTKQNNTAGPIPEFQQGSKVLVYKPVRCKGRAEKLIHRYVGPCTVIKRISPVNWEVEMNNKTIIVHTDKMKPFWESEKERALVAPAPQNEQKSACKIRPRLKKS
jgi:RNase H-like domain found in reverse transcriptase/Reverse transcriptase (RNA-dependent DNA polymerase)/Integrase zinc binding domain/Integrase core domain/gag-polyprotein putative aspartyl protease